MKVQSKPQCYRIPIAKKLVSSFPFLALVPNIPRSSTAREQTECKVLASPICDFMALPRVVQIYLVHGI